MFMWFFMILVIVIIVYFLITYNSLVNLNTMVKEAFATMDVYLKKRWDLIPNLVEIVKSYADYENDALEKIINMRNLEYDYMSQNDKIDTNEELTGGISKLMAIAESYPDLKASKNFSELSSQLVQIEDDIANSRKYFNAVVKNINNKILMFPSNIIAKMFGYSEMKMFEAIAHERENIGFSI